jgi:Intracellular proteinase inhibitor
MKPGLGVFALVCLVVGSLFAQDAAPAAAPQTSPAKRGWMSRMLHPFSAPKPPPYKDLRLRGLQVTVEIRPQPIKLSETRQMEVRVKLANLGKHPVELTFPSDQRVEIYLRNSAETILTKWSENHAFIDKPESVLINPDEHVEYVQTISTRELSPGKVFIVEVFFPTYPELRVRQKFMTEA